MNLHFDYYRKLHGWLALSLLILLIASCKPQTNTASTIEEATPETELPADFIDFYERFQTDSAFQMAHINFPLEGLQATLMAPDSANTQKFYWKPETWRQQRKINDPKGEFESWFVVIDPGLVEHWIHLKNTPMKMFRRFAKSKNDTWMLIYYQDMRPM